jgi:hypothetical protein
MRPQLNFDSWISRVVLCLGLVCLAAGCTTRPKIDWNSRVGSYTYDQAVMDYGPPEKSAELSDRSLVAEWLTRRGAYRVDSYGYSYYGRPYYRPYGYYPGYATGPYDVSRTPDYFLRLIFDPEGRLKGFNQFSK